MVGKIKASIYPDTLLADLLVFLRINWPLACLRDIVQPTHLEFAFAKVASENEDLIANDVIPKMHNLNLLL